MAETQGAECIFCRIVAGTIPAARVAENERGVAFRDLHPQAPVHVLVVPRRHVDGLAAAADGEELGALLLLAREVAEREGVAASGYRVVTNCGTDGGQTVGHLHLHVLGGRALWWPPG